MKNLGKYIPFLMFILALGFNSCSEDEVLKSNDTSEILTLEEIKSIAKSHNEAMDFVLKGLKENNVSFKNNENNINEIINNRLNAFYMSEFSQKIDITSANSYSQAEVDRIISLSTRNGNLKTSSLSPIQTVIQNYSENLSDNQIQFLEDIESSLASSPNDFNKAITDLNQIEDTAIATLTQEEALPIIAGVEIGKASLSYWKDNIGEWQQAISEGNLQLKWFDWSELAGSDVAGAVGGAVGAAVVNLVPGPGQVAYGGAILGGAAGASASDAVMQVWNHYF